MATTLTCQRCGSDLGPGDRFCALCGTAWVACQGCARPLLDTDLSCPHCGTPADPVVAPDPADDEPSPWAEMVERLRRATLGEFEIGPELGRGGMAAVFLAHDLALDRQVAIKVMSPALMLGDGMTDRFRQEAVTIARLHHPHIVPVYSVRQGEGLHYFVMRYLQGSSLEQVIRRAGRLPLPIVRSILWQVGAALTYAHRGGVIHRDVKPANILIDEDGDAVVTDFGIAKAAERPSQTLTGALVGTPAYMSPEQCRGGEVTWAADQYSLGAVAYELVTGVPPFDGSTFTVMQAQVERAPRPPGELREDCGPEIEAAILRMLAKDPAARWPRMADAMAALGAAPLADDDPLRDELGRLVASAAGPETSPTTPTSPIPRTRASEGWSTPGRLVGGISILPAPAGLEVGDSFMLVAVIRGQHGTRLPPRAVAWASEAPDILRVDAAGAMATGVAPGSAVLTATSKGVSARLRVEVAPPRADEIVIGPAEEPLRVGDEIRLEATPRDKRGWPVARPVSWHSADPAIAEITPQGSIAGRAPGTVRITCSLDDARASIVLPVLPPRVAVVVISDAPASVSVGGTFLLNATPLDRRNLPLLRRGILWTTSDVRVAVVTAEGWVAALQPGTVVLTATCEGASASVHVTVAAETPLPAPGRTSASMGVHGPDVVLRRRSRRSRRRRAAAGLVVAAMAGAGAWALARDRGLSWPVTSGGLDLRRVAPGAVAESVADVVLPAAIDSAAPAGIAITRRPARALRPDSVARLEAEVRDVMGRAVPATPVRWSSSDSTIAWVEPETGRMHPLRPGRVQVVAAHGAWRDSAMIVVRRRGGAPPHSASLAIAAPPALRVGESAALTAVVLDARGDTVVGADVAWSSNDPRIAVIDPLTGVVRAEAPGTVLMWARVGREAALAEVTVLPAPVAELQIFGERPMAVGETLVLRVRATDALGGPLDGRLVTWGSADSAVAGVDPGSGQVVAHAPGLTHITAAVEGVSTRIPLTVLARPERVPAPVPDVARQRAEAAVREGVDRCYAALRARDVGRVTALYRPATRVQRETLKKLTRLLRTSAGPEVGERLDHDLQLGTDAATMDFGVRLSWTSASGERLAGQPLFRAEFARQAERWTMTSCRIVGSPGL